MTPHIEPADHALAPENRRAALVGGAWGFGLLKLSLDVFVLAVIPLGTVAGLLLLGALFSGGEISLDSDLQNDFGGYAGPAIFLLPLSLVIMVLGAVASQRSWRRAGLPRPRSLCWATFGIVALPWIVVWMLLLFITLGVASTQTYPADDQYWAMWPLFAAAVAVDAAFGALTGALVALWLTRSRARARVGVPLPPAPLRPHPLPPALPPPAPPPPAPSSPPSVDFATRD